MPVGAYRVGCGMIGLTSKQAELLGFIETYMAVDGVSPSFDEMRRAVNLKSKSGIHRLISALEERGFIRRMHNRARALEVMNTNPLAAFTTEQLQAEIDNRASTLSVRAVA